VGFGVTDQLLIRYFYHNTVHQLFVDLKEAYDSVKREVLYNILIEFWVPMKLISLIRICLNETYIKFLTGKHMSGKFLIQKDLKQGDALSPLIFSFALEYAIRKFQVKLSLCLPN
jgi:hypothetical protein